MAYELWSSREQGKERRRSEEKIEAACLYSILGVGKDIKAESAIDEDGDACDLPLDRTPFDDDSYMPL